jgi:UDP-2,3-diacylglucosamine pyrophosphatase LpxH
VIYLILSDLHLGKGKFLKNGQLNILEDFFEDEKFAEFLEYYSSGQFYLKNVHLVLNGDILNLIQIDNDGVFSHIVDEKLSIKGIDKIYQGHRQFFDAIREFLKSPNKKVTYIIGNHDAAMAFPGAKKRLQELIGEDLNIDFELDENGVYIEHGHKYEVINTVPMKNYFLEGPNGKEILNLPWGSLFCINVLPRLRKERPYIDKVRPLNSYIRWVFFHDFVFFLRMTRTVLSYLWETNKDIYTKQNRNFKTTLKLLKQITIYPNYERKAKGVLKKKRHIHTVVMGHTHVQEWRRFPEGKYYFNTGTWNQIPTMDAGLHESNVALSYCLLDVHEKSQSLRSGALNLWQGKWRPYLGEVLTL